MAKAVGIDLGTTNSVVAVLEGGEPGVAPNAEGQRTTPSVVAFSKSGEILVGEVAKRQAITNPDRTIRSIKRFMGTDHKTDIDGKGYTPQEISARILMKLKADAEAYLGDRRSPRPLSRSPPTSTTPSGRPPRKPARSPASRCGDHQRAHRGCFCLRPLRGGDRRSSSSTSVAGRRRPRSTWVRGSSRCEPPREHDRGDDWDQRVIDHPVKTFKDQHGVDPPRTRWPPAPQGGCGEGEDRASTQQTSINLPLITATEQACSTSS